MQAYADWIYSHKAYVMWFHAAHHLSKGSGFAGDHVNLYGKIYADMAETFDGVVERVLGLTDDETMACPNHIAVGASSKLQAYGLIPNQPDISIAAAALDANKKYLEYLGAMVSNLKQTNSISIGTEDFVAGICNQLEEYNYLLQQRIKITISQ